MSVSLRKFRSVLKTCHTGVYPYELPQDKSDSIPYYEMLGRGPPPTDVAGNPGDVYIDVDVTTPLLVYVRDMDQWRQWNELPGTDGRVKRVHLAVHPILADRYLRFWKRGRTRGLSWVTDTTVKAMGIEPQSARIDPTEGLTQVFKNAHERLSIGRGSMARGSRVKRERSESPDQYFNDSSDDPSASRSRAHARRASSRQKVTPDLSDEEDELIESESDLNLTHSPSRNSPSHSGRSVPDLSAKASELTTFITLADDARLAAERKAQSLQLELDDARAALTKETEARTVAEANLINTEAKYTKEKETHALTVRDLRDKVFALETEKFLASRNKAKFEARGKTRQNSNDCEMESLIPTK
ncbi:hypothetical protein H0H81_001795 [Sphagnurus paluster]|uniref:Uncharacterized protein n=1 Tax=Sphagnurus paluster TaxID=117069 RepID=A0A9P7FT50_9AGAR|nr:hypothetical protein H0H81_001795 [Sphagnurus paluster]